MEPTTSEDALKIFEMTTKALKYSINLFDKAVVGFERLDYNFERSSTLGKYNQTALHATEKTGKEESINVETLLPSFLHLYLLFYLFYYFKIKFMGMTLVNKIIHVSSVHFYGTQSVYFTVFPPPIVKSFL